MAKKNGNGRSAPSSSHKLARFGFDVLRSILKKYSSLLTADNLSGFLPFIGDALVQGYEEVKVSAIRLLSTIVKLPLPEIDKNSDVYLTEAVKLIKEAQSTNSETAQAALKLIAAILRERRATKLRDSHLAYLLKRLSADVEEPDRQGVTFNFIRAIMARKFIVPELYELVDNITAMMVTSHSRSARDLARGVYIQFMVEYPQAKSRWVKQLGFLAKNLEYQHQEGRQSVMEAVHILLSKTSGDLAQDIVATFFVPVVMAMSNDESSECREMAGVLLGSLYSRADSEQLKSMLAPLRAWLDQTENSALTNTGLQAMRIYFEAEATGKENEVKFVTSLLSRIIATAVDNADNNEWEMFYYSLQLFTKLCRLFPALVMTQDCAPIWSGVRTGLGYPHSWIKSCAANLIGIWLADEARANAASGYGSVPLVGASGLALDGNAMLDITRTSMLCLNSLNISEVLATQIVRNVIFLGRCFSQNNLAFSREKMDEFADDISDESDGGVEDTLTNPATRDTMALRYIFEQSSAILRREPVTARAESLVSKAASMKLLAALCSHLELAHIMPALQIILLPLLHLTDPSISQPRSTDESLESAYKNLVTSSQEILDLLQKKLGTTEFVAQMAVARESVKARRDGRRVKRRIDAVANPEKFGLDKKRKNDRKREKRKVKALDFRDRRRGW
jgi:U3 small nucleolar RNA-associated protein 20